jgi:hypothetical protein
MKLRSPLRLLKVAPGNGSRPSMPSGNIAVGVI